MRNRKHTIYIDVENNEGDMVKMSFKECSDITGHKQSSIKSRYYAVRNGAKDYTPRQVAGFDKINYTSGRRPKIASPREKKRAPLGSQYFIHASFYKIANNMTWIFIGDEWRRSGKEVHEVKAGCRV